MDHIKIKILTMLKEGRINIYETLELLNAIQEDDSTRTLVKMRRKGKRLCIKIISDGKTKESHVDVNDLFLSAIMSRINAELKYNGINLLTEDLKNIRDEIISSSKARLERESELIEIVIV